MASEPDLLDVVRQALCDAVVDDDVRGRIAGATLHTRLATLGIDSLTATEAVAFIEDRAGVVMPDEALDGPESVGALVDFLSAALARR